MPGPAVSLLGPPPDRFSELKPCTILQFTPTVNAACSEPLDVEVMEARAPWTHVDQYL